MELVGKKKQYFNRISKGKSLSNNEQNEGTDAEQHIGMYAIMMNLRIRLLHNNG